MDKRKGHGESARRLVMPKNENDLESVEDDGLCKIPQSLKLEHLPDTDSFRRYILV